MMEFSYGYKASEAKEKMPLCPFCNTGQLHQHIVLIDKGITNYLLSLGNFKEELDKSNGGL